MGWFSGSSKNNPFEMFSESHVIVLAILFIVSAAIFLFRRKLRRLYLRFVEISLAITLIIFETLYQIWQVQNEIWNRSSSIPLELCNISLFLTIILLFTRRRIFYEILLFTGLLGASQALFTPILSYDFPHFRFLHFFFTHLMMIWVPLYFTWVQRYRPTIWSVIKLFVFLNVLMPLILFINKLTDGNYMFLSRKPESTSLLDYLGPYPYYIISMEGLLICLSLIVWLLFREKSTAKEKKPKSFSN
ncbi:TIGR02206 family membrane protein [Neobacillus mesonae]|uniref:YwaF family protein n=1 Tax=Neobacillus mesonae TaxID=1193713 RepID=UPI00203A3EEE|nr:TIGR02206 family membrane protein [Neobacillus mesonae]MCM3571296.1 TIGR02206 family membrane protein [Neobacillus mesonae]